MRSFQLQPVLISLAGLASLALCLVLISPRGFAQSSESSLEDEFIDAGQSSRPKPETNKPETNSEKASTRVSTRVEDESSEIPLEDDADFNSIVGTSDEGVVGEKAVKAKKAKRGQSKQDNPSKQNNPNSVPALDSEIHGLALEDENLDANIFALDQLAEEASQESEKLQHEVSTLERQVKGQKSVAARAKNRSDLAFKRLALQEQRKKEANLRLRKTEQEARREQKKLAKVESRVRVTQENSATAKMKTKQRLQELREVQREQAALDRRLKRVKAQIAAAERQQQLLRDKRQRIERENKRKKAALIRSEKRLAAASRR